MNSALNLRDPLLLVICTGNVCRSPMAEAVLVHYVNQASLGAQIISRGLAAPIGRAPHPHTITVLAAHGIAIPTEKRAADVTGAEMAAATAIFVMDSGHRKEIQKRFPTASGKVFLLGQWQSQEIADPINEPLPAFELAWQQIDIGVKTWVERLKEAGMLKYDCPVT